MAEGGIFVRLQPTSLDAERELEALLGAASGDGAVVSFVGLTRSEGKEGSAVRALVLQHHAVLTEESMREIAAAAFDRFEVSHVRVVHRCGTVAPGEPVVFAGAAARHRRSAFEAVDYLMDRLKTDAVFWKHEEGPDGRTWIEPTDADHQARARWEA